jgi:hypothetical protein
MGALARPRTPRGQDGEGVSEHDHAGAGHRAGREGARARVATWLPTIGRLRGYSLGWLRDDVVAGITLSALLVPVGMGYAEAAGLPAIAGLYATVGPLVAYFLIGPSRILVIGPDSSLLPLVAAAVVPLAAGDPVRAVALGSALAVMVGVICLAAALARLGFLTDLLSRPVRVGYMNGIALTVLVGQLPKMLGFKVEAPDFLGAVIGLVRASSTAGPTSGRSRSARSPWRSSWGSSASPGGSPACSSRSSWPGWRSRPSASRTV